VGLNSAIPSLRFAFWLALNPTDKVTEQFMQGSRVVSSIRLGLAAVVCGTLLFTGACGSGGSGSGSSSSSDPTEVATYPAPQVTLGERLFLDTRFAEYFATHMTGINQPLNQGDPVVATVQTTSGTLPGPFAGQSINCRSCHFVTEFEHTAGNRTYADFTTRSPLPRTINGFDHTPRNALVMVNSLLPRPGPIFLHSDGEFNDAAKLVLATLTGRNFGWSPDEYNQAIAQIAQVIRQDDGTGKLAVERTDGLSYSNLFLGSSPANLPLLIPFQYRLDVQNASDAQVVAAVANFIEMYMADLTFKRDAAGNYYGSPYDIFLLQNALPRQPSAGETIAAYNQNLLQAINALKKPKFVTGGNRTFQYHSQKFQFGSTELAGLKIFLSSAVRAADGSQHAGNCAACHAAPNFTDNVFHCTGVSQEEYDAANGAGTFMNLAIPSLAVRNANYNQYLPMTANHPSAGEGFRHIAVQGQPQFADLGLWNVYLNPDMPDPQSDLASVVCSPGHDCSLDQGLANTIAQFKTPSLRDLEDSNPYFHNGSKLTLTEVINFYVFNSQLARDGNLRNSPPEFQNMSIDQSDVRALVAFLQSLTEDYDDTHLSPQ
jgi:cytochrome c peroxidase